MHAINLSNGTVLRENGTAVKKRHTAKKKKHRTDFSSYTIELHYRLEANAVLRYKKIVDKKSNNNKDCRLLCK